MEFINEIGCGGKNYTEIICNQKELRTNVIPSKTYPLSCGELAIDIVNWIDFYDNQENKALIRGHNTSDVVIATPQGNLLFAHDFAKEALPYKKISKLTGDKEIEEIVNLSQNKREAWEMYYATRELTESFEVKKRHLKRLVQSDCVPKNVDLLGDKYLSKLDGIRKDIMNFLFRSKNLVEDYIDKVNTLREREIKKFAENLETKFEKSELEKIINKKYLEDKIKMLNNEEYLPGFFFGKARNQIPTFEIIRMNGILPLGFYFSADGKIGQDKYSFLYNGKSPFKRGTIKFDINKKRKSPKINIQFITREDVSEDEFEMLKKIAEEQKIKKLGVLKG